MDGDTTHNRAWLISIIIPVYNVEEHLTKCLDSVINQTYSNLEIILIDDGSTDRSGAICDEYAKLDKRIKVAHNKNSGVSKARNTGIQICTGEFVAFVDSDDYVENNYISTLVEPLMKDDYDFVFCSYIDFNVETDQKSYHCFTEKELRSLTGDFYKDYHIFKQLLWYPWIKLYKRTIIQNNNIWFPEELTDGEDQFFNFSYFEKIKKYKFINQALYIYCHRHVISLSNQKTLRSYYSNLTKLKKEKEFYKKHNIACYDNLLINNAMGLILRYSILDSSLDYRGFKLRTKGILQVVWEEFKNIKNLSYKWRLVRGCFKNNIFFPLYFYYLLKHFKQLLLVSKKE